MKILRCMLMSLVLLALAVTLTACGDSLEGSWKLTGGTAADALYGYSGATLDEMGAEVVFDFRSDAVLVVRMSGGAAPAELSGTWAADGDTVTLTLDGASTACTWSVIDDRLSLFFTLNGQNASFDFVRQ